MNTPRKLSGASELVKFKILWRDSMSDSARDYWRALFISLETQAALRKQLSAKLKINLNRDDQLTAFRSWLDDQDARDAEAARMIEDERRLKEVFGDKLSKDEVREKVLAASYARTLATGDFKLGLSTIREDRGLIETMTNRDKFLLDSDVFFDSMLKKAAELNTSNLSNAEKISAMRAEAFKSVDELQASGRIKIPKA